MMTTRSARRRFHGAILTGRKRHIVYGAEVGGVEINPEVSILDLNIADP